MMNTQYARNGFSIAVQLDLDGKPTDPSLFLVINSTGEVVHVAASFEQAVTWIDEQVNEPKPPRNGYRNG